MHPVVRIPTKDFVAYFMMPSRMVLEFGVDRLLGITALHVLSLPIGCPPLVALPAKPSSNDVLSMVAQSLLDFPSAYLRHGYSTGVTPRHAVDWKILRQRSHALQGRKQKGTAHEALLPSISSGMARYITPDILLYERLPDFHRPWPSHETKPPPRTWPRIPKPIRLQPSTPRRSTVRARPPTRFSIR